MTNQRAQLVVSSGACANHSMRPHSAQMRIDADGSAQSTLKTVRVRELRSALPGANFPSPQCGHRTGRPATVYVLGCVPSLKALAPAFSASKKRAMVYLPLSAEPRSVYRFTRTRSGPSSWCDDDQH